MLYIFYNCSGLTTFIIPNNVTYIGDFAFGICSGLTSIHCKSETPINLRSTPFDYKTTNFATLYVPKGSIDAYKSAYKWREFQNILEE